MKVEKDFEEFIELLNKHGVKYLIVGAYALALYGVPRNTGDIDIFIERSEENAKKILNVLSDFGFDDLELSLTDFTTEEMVIQLGIPPVIIDIITSISGVEFDESYTSKVETKFGKIFANFISLECLIKNKKASARKKDQADLELLMNVTKNKKMISE